MSSQNSATQVDQAWKRPLYIMFLAQLVTMVGFSSIFPFLPLYVTSLGAATSLGIDFLTGLVFSAQAFTMMIASPLWGALADRWGRKLMVERAMFGGALILGLMAFVRSAEELVVLRAVQGLITGTIGAANALVAAVVPRAQAGFAMGLMQVGVGIGLGLGPIIGGAVADAFGYRAAFYVTAAMLAVAGVIVWLGVQEPPRSRQAQPHAAGLLRQWIRVLRAPGVTVLYSMRFLNHMGRMVFIPSLPLFALLLIRNAQRVNSFTGLTIGISSAATAIFAIYLGRLGDRLGHRPILIVCSFLGALFFGLQSLSSQGWHLLVLMGLTGAALGGIVPGVSALLANYTPPGDEGMVYGLDNAIVSAARMVGPLLGVGVAAWLGLRGVFAAAAVTYLAAAGLALLGLSDKRRP